MAGPLQALISAFNKWIVPPQGKERDDGTHFEGPVWSDNGFRGIGDIEIWNGDVYRDGIPLGVPAAQDQDGFQTLHYVPLKGPQWMSADTDLIAVATVADLSDRNKVPAEVLGQGKVVFVREDKTFYELLVEPQFMTNTSADWKRLNLAMEIVDQAWNLPDPASVQPGEMFLVRTDLDGRPLNRIVMWDPPGGQTIRPIIIDITQRPATGVPPAWIDVTLDAHGQRTKIERVLTFVLNHSSVPPVPGDPKEINVQITIPPNSSDEDIAALMVSELGRAPYNTVFDIAQNNVTPYIVRITPKAGNSLDTLRVAIPLQAPTSDYWKYLTRAAWIREQADPGPNPGDVALGDVDVLVDQNAEIIRYFDGTDWVTVYDHDEILREIAAAGLFEGTVEEDGAVVPEALYRASQLPDITTTVASEIQDLIGKQAHYWVWTGADNYVVPAVGDADEIANGISRDLGGQLINTGDWLQIANIGGDGTGTGTNGGAPVFRWVRVGGDLLTKKRADELYGVKPWVKGSYEAGALVVRDGELYRANAPVTVQDGAPSPGNPKPFGIPILPAAAIAQWSQVTDVNFPPAGNGLSQGDYYQIMQPFDMPGTGPHAGYAAKAGDLFVWVGDEQLTGISQNGVTVSAGFALIPGVGGAPAKPTSPTWDVMPPQSTTNKWTQVYINGIKMAATENQLPASDSLGKVWIVLNHIAAGGGPALFTYDPQLLQMVPISGGGGASDLVWRDQRYNPGDIVYHEGRNAWFFATAVIPPGSPEPGDAAATHIWLKINASHGSTTFFGRGTWHDWPNDATAPAPLSQANNWGMPAGTAPPGQQPQDGDVYYDILTGSEVTFTVTQTPATNVITGTVDPATDRGLGRLSVGASPGRTDFATFAVDGAAQNFPVNAFYRLTIPANFVDPLDAAPSLTVGDQATLDQGFGSLAVGEHALITPGNLSWATLGGDYVNAFGAQTQANDRILRVAQPGVYGTATNGYRVVDGLVRIAANLWPGGGNIFAFNFVSSPNTGFFAGTSLAVGDHLVVYTGDNTAGSRGWTIIDDQAPYDWSVNTQTPQPQPDVITGAQVWGYRRDFEWTIPANAAEDEVYSFISAIPADDIPYHVVVRREGQSGGVFEFEFVPTSVGNPSLSAELVVPTNSLFKEIRIDWDGGANRYFLAAKLAANAAGATYLIEIDTPYPDNIGNLVADGTARGAALGGYGRKIDAQIAYPGEALEQFLRAKSGDASATIPGNKQPGENLNGSVVTIQPGSYHETRGFVWTTQDDNRVLIRLRKPDGNAINKADLNIVHHWSQRLVPGNGAVEDWTDMKTASPDAGFIVCSKQSMKQNVKARWHLIVDRRDPDVTYVEWDILYLDSSGGQRHDHWFAFWPKPGGVEIGQFYYSFFTGYPAEWRGFTD